MHVVLCCYATLWYNQTSDKVPFLADLKPSGKYVMEDVQKIGGTPAVMKVYINNNTIKLYNNTTIKLLNNTDNVYVYAKYLLCSCPSTFHNQKELTPCCH
jgi:dihydroxyacid dehydratase/phosphogluconate dehydratase